MLISIYENGFSMKPMVYQSTVSILLCPELDTDFEFSDFIQ